MRQLEEKVLQMRFLGFLISHYSLLLTHKSKKLNSIIEFPSPNVAAAFTLKDSQNSWTKWIDVNNNPLHSLYKKPKKTLTKFLTTPLCP